MTGEPNRSRSIASGERQIPFLRPELPSRQAIDSYLRLIDESHQYSNFGPLVQRFERRLLADFFGECGAVTTVHNATLGLMLAIRAVKRPSGRYALMPSFTFPAAPLAAMWAGLEPYFVDIQPGTWFMDLAAVEQAVERLDRDVGVVVPYATFGNNLPLAPYGSLHESGVPVVVDAAPGLGSTDAGQQQYGVGFPGAVVFSLHATKPFGVGEGGIVYSGSADLVAHVRQASNFGFGEDRVAHTMGLNAKMPEVTAAIGLAALEDYAGLSAKRREVAGYYVEELASSGASDSGWRRQQHIGLPTHQFMPLLSTSRDKRDAALASMAERGIGARTYFWPPCHVQPAFSGARCGTLDMTMDISERIISLPLYEGMTRGDVVRIVRALG